MTSLKIKIDEELKRKLELISTYNKMSIEDYIVKMIKLEIYNMKDILEYIEGAKK
jgi:hypothetical protein